MSSPENEIDSLQNQQISRAIKYIIKGIITPPTAKYFFLEFQKIAILHGELLKNNEILSLQDIDILKKRFDRNSKLLDTLQGSRRSPSTTLRKQSIIDQELLRILGQVVYAIYHGEVSEEEALLVLKMQQEVSILKGRYQNDWSGEIEPQYRDKVLEKLYVCRDYLNKVISRSRSPKDRATRDMDRQLDYKQGSVARPSYEIDKEISQRRLSLSGEGLQKSRRIRGDISNREISEEVEPEISQRRLSLSGEAIQRSRRVRRELSDREISEAQEDETHKKTTHQPEPESDRKGEVSRITRKYVQTGGDKDVSSEGQEWGRFLEKESTRLVGRERSGSIGRRDRSQLGALEELPVDKISSSTRETNLLYKEEERKKITLSRKPQTSPVESSRMDKRRKSFIKPDILVDLINSNEEIPRRYAEPEVIFLPGLDDSSGSKKETDQSGRRRDFIGTPHFSRRMAPSGRRGRAGSPEPFYSLQLNSNISSLDTLTPISKSLKDGLFSLLWGDLFKFPLKFDLHKKKPGGGKKYSELYVVHLSKYYPLNM